MKLILSFSLFFLFTLKFSSSALGLVWVNSVTVTNPPAMDCTPTFLTVTGDLSATHSFTGTSVNIIGSAIEIFVNYSSGIGLPVITPFSQDANLGLLATGTYTVTTYGVLDGNVQSTFLSNLNVGACCGTSADFSYPTAICLGDIIQLTNSSTGALSQEWFEDGSSASTSTDHSLTPGITGSVLIKLVTSNGLCEDSIEYSINVLDPATISAITPSQLSVCEGELLDLASTTMNATAYVWTDNGTQIGTTSALSFTTSVPGPHIYELIASNGGCADTMNVTVTVNAAPTIDSFSASETSICLGESFDLNSSSTGATAVFWYENGLFLTNGASLTLTPSIDGIYTYQLVVGNANCSDSMEISVSVNPLPVIDNSNASHTTLCIGDIVELSSTSSNATSFEWFENGISVANTNDHSATPSPVGSYTYQLVVEFGGCFDSTELVVNVVGLPVVDLGADTNNCLGPILLDAGSGMNSYLWQDQSTSQTLTPTTTGIYSVTVIDANGCSNSDEMSFESCSSLSEEAGMKVVLYPNPVGLNARIEIEGYTGSVEVRITDVNGKMITNHSEFTSGNIDLDLSDLNSGVYYVHLIMNNANSTLKIIKD